MFQLYDFAFSHYSEKARWALDFKGIPYTPRHLLPGFHLLVTRKLAPRTFVPILETDDAVIQGSAEIIDFLDQTFPDRRLTPSDPQDSSNAVEWEKYLDEEIGVTLRLWFYYYALPDRGRALKFLCREAPWHQRSLFAFLFPGIRRAMSASMNISADNASAAERRFMLAFDRLDQALERGSFLVGNRFSRADLTACALLWPLCRPDESEAEVEAVLPPAVCTLRKQLQHRRFYQWVLEHYQTHRAPLKGGIMPEYSAPGVYVEEIPFKARTIEGVPTSTTAFIGPTRITPLETDSAKREPVRSFLEFEQQYGGLDDLQTAQGSRCNYIAHAARAFFDNGGQRLYIGQVAADASAAEYAAALLALPEGISVIAAPGTSAEIQQALIEHVNQPERFRFAVLDAPPGATIDEVLAARSGIDSSYAAMYYPWITTAESLHLPPSGFVCGIFARVDNTRGVWKAPANETVIGAVDLQAAIDTSGQERLSAQGINSIRAFPGRGILLWGARTTSLDSQWKYVNVRRYFIYLEQSIHDGLQWVVFEPNGEQLWETVRQTVSNFLLNNWQSGALMGTRPEEAFFVRCDRTTMTQNDIDNGRLIVEIGVAPVRPAEFVIIRIGLWTASRCETC